MSVIDYRTGDALEGAASPELAAASHDAPCGAVSAYEDGGVWRPTPNYDDDILGRQGYTPRRLVWVDG